MDLYPRLRFSLLLAGIVGVLAPAVLRAAPPYPRQRVVYDLGTGNPEKWRVALENVKNHVAAVGRSRIDLALVVHGPGVWMLVRARTDPGFARRLKSLLALGVRFWVSADALGARGLRLAQLGVVGPGDVVPSGAAEIVALERQGYIYIKP